MNVFQPPLMSKKETTNVPFQMWGFVDHGLLENNILNDAALQYAQYSQKANKLFLCT